MLRTFPETPSLKIGLYLLAFRRGGLNYAAVGSTSSPSAQLRRRRPVASRWLGMCSTYT